MNTNCNQVLQGNANYVDVSRRSRNVRVFHVYIPLLNPIT